MFSLQRDTRSLRCLLRVPGTLPRRLGHPRNVTMDMVLEDATVPGKHTISVWGMTAGVVLERIWVDMGGDRCAWVFVPWSAGKQDGVGGMWW
jgi:hypothetical protein